MFMMQLCQKNQNSIRLIHNQNTALSKITFVGILALFVLWGKVNAK